MLKLFQIQKTRVLQLRKLKQICKHMISFANKLFAIFLADSLSNFQQTAKDHPVYPRENRNGLISKLEAI